MNVAQELITQKSVDELREHLLDEDRVVYRENGNRAADGKAFLKKIQALSPAFGVTRVAEISQLAETAFPVFQATRPNLLHHAAVGKNTGAQGKGPTRTQAMLSCLMETMESFCDESRNVHLVRGSYEFLREQHALLHPGLMIHRPGVRPPADDETLLWSPVYHVESDSAVLAPAELVYADLPVDSYRVRPVFPTSSNGLAAGATYLEAVIHGLYEVIERMYVRLAESGAARIEALFESDYELFDAAEFNKGEGHEFELQLFAVKIRRIKNIPMVVCFLAGDQESYEGGGCCGDVDTAIMRAISEAMQCYATNISGSREDLAQIEMQESARDHPLETPRRRSLRIESYKKQVSDRKFAALRDEYRALVDWVHAAGHKTICVANLTRTGLEIPTVKVIVPGMPARESVRGFAGEARGWNLNDVIQRRYGLG
jgi:ribosomal protein S12 methylthiotransferase accessory factor